jgi:hypothetical protein
MCYLIREARSEPERGAAAPLPSLHSPRPRWIGAAAATLIGGLAVAALVGPPSAPPPAKAEQAAGPAPVVERTSTVPLTAVVEQRSAAVDDGVPTPSDVVKAGMGECGHGM